MKVLAKYVTRKSRGGIALRDDLFDCQAIRIGRGTSCEVELSDPRILLEQARITVRSGDIYIEALSGGSVTVNGTLVQTAKVVELDVLEIGPFQVIIEPRENDSDVTLSIELLNPLGDELDNIKANAVMNIGIVGTSKRMWSWTLFAVVIAVLLIWPMAVSWFTPPPIINLQSGMTYDIEPMPTSVWTSGGISSAHKFFGESCEACHERPFVPVQDSSCITCHQTIEHHADPIRFPSTSFEDFTCQNCHKEHQGDESIARNDQGFCVDCHGSLREKEPGSTLRNVSDFGTDHPDLYPSVVVNASLHSISRAVPMSSTPGPRESSGLSFPHADHLRDAGVRHPRLGIIQLGCRSCHVPDEGGVSMLPISFERHCHQCHKLTFDTQLPGREMLHEKPEELFQQISDVYDSAALRGGYTEPEAPPVIRRRPGTPLSEEDRRVARDWAEEKTGAILNGRFGRGQCEECHTIFNNAPVGVWIIEPVQITEQWFPKSVFDHASHSDVGCTTCHDVNNSTSSTDVLMPKIETCQACHGGEGASDRVPSTCITCHQFHNDDLGALKSTQEEAAATLHRGFTVIQPNSLPKRAEVIE